MKLSDYKLTEFKTKISELPTKIVNRAQWLKEQFDARGTELQQALNALIDALAANKGETGASLLGAVDWKGKSITIQDHIQDVDDPHNIKERIRVAVEEAVQNTGAADMTRAVYDPQGKQQDVFAYTDNAIAAAIGSALNGEV